MTSVNCKFGFVSCMVASMILLARASVSDTYEATCTVSNERQLNETLGHYLLRQTIPSLAKDRIEELARVMPFRLANPTDIGYDLWWYHEDMSPSFVYSGFVPPKSVKQITTFPGHIFCITHVGSDPNDPHSRIWQLIIDENVHFEILDCEDETDDYYLSLLEEKRFAAEYEKESGRAWIHHYPRPKPHLNMWSVDQGIGSIHPIITNQTHWKCIPNDFQNQSEVSECHKPGAMEMGVEVLSQEPKIFVIENAISDAETELLRSLSLNKLARSREQNPMGNTYLSDAKTSQTAFLSRSDHPILETLYRRTADILGIDESLLHLHQNADHLRSIRYTVGQTYRAHYDYGDVGNSLSSLLTLIYYLNDLEDGEHGGQTIFPRANNGEGLAFHPGKGNAVLFYNLLEDGNGDINAVHEGSTLHRGVKWITNLVVWDPHVGELCT